MKTILSFLLLLCTFKVFAVLPQVNFTFASRDITEGQEVTVTAELSSLTENGVTVPFTVTGSASSDDHDLVAGTIYISPNHKKGFITFKVFADGVPEGTENILISLLAPMNASLGSMKTHTIFIHDEDEVNLPIVNFTSTSNSTPEGNLMFVEATLSEASTQLVIVPFSVGGTAQYPIDHNLIDGNLIFFPGSTTATLSILVNEDGQAESNETIVIHLNAPVVNANLGTRNSHIITIESTSVVQPVADFSIGLSNGGVAPTQGSFNANLSYLPGHQNETDRGITSCTWVLSEKGTGSIIIPGCLYQPIITESGHYSLTLTVTSLNGAFSSISKNFDVLPNLIPIANFSVNPSSGTTPLEITLDGTSSQDPDGGAISEYQWDFGNGVTSVTSTPLTHYTYNSSGTFIIKLSVKDNEGSLSAAKTFTISVSNPVSQGSIAGITYKETSIVGNVPVTITFTTDNSTFNTISDENGNFNFELPLSGNYIITATQGDLKGTFSGNLISSNSSQEAPVNLFKTGIGKFSGTAVMVDNQSEVVPNAIIVIRAYDNSYEGFTTTDSQGKFNFENLPLVGRYYIALFHEDGRFRNSSFFISASQPEITNINYLVVTLPGFPFLANAAFSLGGFNFWYGGGNLTLIPQDAAFGYSKAGLFDSHTQPTPIPYHFPIEWYEEDLRLPPPRPQQKNKFKNLPMLFVDKTLPCENRNFAAVATTSDGTGLGQLEQYITIEDDADTLIGRVKFLTNETTESAELGYNDTFTVLFSNPTRSIFLKQSDVKSLTWGPGILGFQFATQEFSIALDVRDLRGKKAKLSFLVFDRGDFQGVSGIVLSNFQMIKGSERNLVEMGSINGDSSLTNNLGAVSWFKIKNPKALSAFTINNQDFHVLKHNEETTVSSVKFANEPMSRTFNFDTLNSTDIFSYTLESNWVTSMPISACGGGR